MADRGPGVQDGDPARLFDKFYRGPQKEKKGGAGLGLSICKGIMEIHGGTIEALDNPGGGALFRFTIPLRGEVVKIQEETHG